MSSTPSDSVSITTPLGTPQSQSVMDSSDEDKLLAALESGDFHTALQLLPKDSPSPPTVGPDNLTPLHYACQHGRADIALLLITEYNYSINFCSNAGQTPLHFAAKYGQLEIAKLLVQQSQPSVNTGEGSNNAISADSVSQSSLTDSEQSTSKQQLLQHETPFLSAVDNDGNTPLHLAATRGHLHLTKYLTHEAHYNPAPINNKNQTPLHLAAMHGHLEVLQYLVEEEGCDPSARDEQGRTPLYLAAGSGQLDVVKYLATEKQCDPNCRTTEHKREIQRKMSGCYKTGRTPLHAASEGGHLGVAQYLIDELNCNPSCTDDDGHTPLHVASLDKQITIVKFLTEEKHCDPLCTTNSGKTPLHDAALGGSLEVVKFFVSKKGCDPMCRDRWGRTPLHNASQEGHLEIVKYLINEQQVDPSCLDKKFKLTPLRLASERGHIAIVKFLTEEKHCNPLHTDKFGNTPLHGAALGGSLEVVKFFINEKGCDPMCRGQWGRTPLHRASQEGHLEIVTYLIDEQQAKPSCHDGNDSTPLSLASQYGHMAVVKFLTDEKNCNPLHKHKTGNTSIHWAALEGHLEVVKFFIGEKGYDPMCRGQGGRTPLHDASQEGHFEIVRYLIDEQQAEPSCLDDKNVTPLHMASLNGHLDVVKYLVEHKHCDPTVKAKNGETPVEIAIASKQTDVVQYLISKGATLSKYVFRKGVAISPVVKIHVVGNSGSGKSSLVKALQDEDSPITGRVFNVSGVIPKTSGIIPMELDSKNFGKVTLYDLAGHEEYYAGHEAIFESTSLPIILLTVNLSNSPDKIRKAISYWESLVGNAVSTSVHVIAIGSHSDTLTAHDLQMKSAILSEVMESSSTFSCIRHVGWVTLDCRKSSSTGISTLRQLLHRVCKSVRIEGDFDYKNAAVLNVFLKNQLSNMKACSLTELLTWILESRDSNLEQLNSPHFLFQTCESLNKSGHILFLKNKDKPEESWLILKKGVILSDVHGLLKHVKLSNTSGIVSQTQLKAILKNSSVDLHIDLVRRYLVQMEFCIQIESHLLELIGDSELPHIKENCFLFPDLLGENRPGDVWRSNSQFTYSTGWGLKCTESSHFFTPRFLQVLLVHLASRFALNPRPESPGLLEPAQGCKLWKNGIRWQDGWGIEAIVEFSDQNTVLNVMMRCFSGSEVKLIQMRSSIIHHILNAKEHICPKINSKEYLIHPTCLQCYPMVEVTELPVKCILEAIKNEHPYIRTEKSNSDFLSIRELLYFEPYQDLSVELLQQLFDMQHGDKGITDDTLCEVATAFQNQRKIFSKLCDKYMSRGEVAKVEMDSTMNEAQKCLRILTRWPGKDRTYGSLRHFLNQYSIFAGRNPLTLEALSPAQETPSDDDGIIATALLMVS